MIRSKNSSQLAQVHQSTLCLKHWIFQTKGQATKYLSSLNYKRDKSNARPIGFLWDFRGDKITRDTGSSWNNTNSVLSFFTLLCPNSCCCGKEVECSTLDWSPLSASENGAFWRSLLPYWAVESLSVFSQVFGLIIFSLLPHFAPALSCYHRLPCVEDIQLSAAIPQLLLWIGRRGWCERVIALNVISRWLSSLGSFLGLFSFLGKLFQLSKGYGIGKHISGHHVLGAEVNDAIGCHGVHNPRGRRKWVW